MKPPTRTDRPVLTAWCDGGVVGPNPSALGGTWAWRHLDADGLIVDEASGAVEPCDLGVAAVTNNQTELLAALLCLQALPRGWSGTLFTDSMVTRQRLTCRNDFKNTPAWMTALAKGLRKGRRWKIELVAGHPTRRDLNQGFASRNGMPVSDHNVAIDRLCNEAAARLRQLCSRG